MRLFLAAAVALGSLAGCSLPPPKPLSGQGDGPANSADLTIGFGSLGPAKVEMTKSEAMKTGLFDRSGFDATRGCRATALKPKKQFENIGARTDKSGTIRSLRVSGPGPETLYGIGVGTHFANVVESYGGSLKGPTKVGTNRSGAFVAKDGAWIGFLFDVSPEELDVEDAVSLIEVTKGTRPRLNPSC